MMGEAGPTIFEEKTHRFVIREDADRMALPGGAPDHDSKEEDSEFQISDVPVQKVRRDTASKIFICPKVVSAKARLFSRPSVRAGIDGHIASVGEMEDGLTVPGTDRLMPPQ